MAWYCHGRLRDCLKKILLIPFSISSKSPVLPSLAYPFQMRKGERFLLHISRNIVWISKLVSLSVCLIACVHTSHSFLPRLTRLEGKRGEKRNINCHNFGERKSKKSCGEPKKDLIKYSSFDYRFVPSNEEEKKHKYLYQIILAFFQPWKYLK